MAKEEDREEAEDQEEGGEEPKGKEPQVKVDEDGNSVTVETYQRRKPRGERRAERDRELGTLREQNAQFQRQLDEMRQVVISRSQQPAPQQQAPVADPHSQEIEHIRREQEMIQTALRTGTVTENQEIERLRKRYYELDQREHDVREERFAQKVIERVKREVPNGPRQGEYEEATLRNEFPDVIDHQQAMQYARGTFWQLVAEGKAPVLATSREAMNRAAERFGLRQTQRPAATPLEQQRFGAVPQQAGVRTNGNNGIRLNQQQMKMALARWPSDDDNVAFAKMAQLLATTSREGEPPADG